LTEIIVPNPIDKIKVEDLGIDDLRHLSKDSFALWALTSGARIDGHFIDFERHRYLLPIYMDDSKEIVWRKSAQVGATAYMTLKLINFCATHENVKAGLYFPTETGASLLSKDRLSPLLESLPQLDYKDNGNLSLRRIGSSSLYVFHLGGKASKDSVPLDMIAFDEVRLVSSKDIDQALERISHSELKYKIFMSTCGIPSADIDLRYQGGKQFTWTSTCNCTDGCNLAYTFPNCVIEHPKHGIILVCPKCKTWIKDPQNGRYVSMNPSGDYNSYHVSQLASKFISIKEIWDFYKRTTNMAEFYNAKLGLPYVDEQNRGITRDQLSACVDPMLEWSKPERKESDLVMGVDQGAGYVYLTIASIQDGKRRIRHQEIIESDNPNYMENGVKVSPFKHLHRLMKVWDIKLCVVDAMPNANEAMEFAAAFPGRVFIQYFAKDAKDVVQWGDKPKHKAVVRKAGPLFRFKYHCIINKYIGLQWMYGEWAKGNVVSPDPSRLVQMCRDEKLGVFGPGCVAERAFDMYTRHVRKFTSSNDETGEGKFEWIYTGGDPHFSFATLNAFVALERIRRQATFAFL